MLFFAQSLRLPRLLFAESWRRTSRKQGGWPAVNPCEEFPEMPVVRRGASHVGRENATANYHAAGKRRRRRERAGLPEMAQSPKRKFRHLAAKAPGQKPPPERSDAFPPSSIRSKTNFSQIMRSSIRFHRSCPFLRLHASARRRKSVAAAPFAVACSEPGSCFEDPAGTEQRLQIAQRRRQRDAHGFLDLPPRRRALGSKQGQYRRFPRGRDRTAGTGMSRAAWRSSRLLEARSPAAAPSIRRRRLPASRPAGNSPGGPRRSATPRECPPLRNPRNRPARTP